jgi:hypothetical protein
LAVSLSAGTSYCSEAVRPLAHIVRWHVFRWFALLAFAHVTHMMQNTSALEASAMYVQM